MNFALHAGISLMLVLSGVTFAQSPDVHFRINQAGYVPLDHKSAVVFSDYPIKGSFQLFNAGTEKIVFTGKVVPSPAPGYGPHKFNYLLDFSALSQAGSYVIRIGKSQSADTVKVGSFLYQGYPDELLAFLRQQRCGYNPFFDVVCHQGDGRILDGPMQDSTYLDVTGGWHDAGDQLKYLITASNAVVRMLIAYQLFPKSFDDRYNALGQPGANGMADVLDESKWGLDWILKLHPAPGQLIHQVGDDRDHVGWKLPQQDPSNYGWGKDSYRVAYYATGRPQGLGKYKSEATGIANLAGRSAAALALGFQIWNKRAGQESFAKICLQAAEELYRMAKKQEGYQQGNSYGAPYRYNENTWTDDMELAASELYKATGQSIYLDDAKIYAEQSGELSWIQNDTTAHYERYPFLNIAHFSLYQSVDDPFKARLAGYYKNGIEKTLIRASKNPFSNGVPFIWCSNNLLVDLVLQIILYERMTGDLTYHAYMTHMRDWLFGRNPWGTSMFTGIPKNGRYPRDVHTSTWALTKKEVPGGLVDGPIYYDIYKKLLGLKLTHADAFEKFQNTYVVYHDDIGDYSTNEPTMDGTACAVMLMAYLADFSGSR